MILELNSALQQRGGQLIRGSEQCEKLLERDLQGAKTATGHIGGHRSGRTAGGGDGTVTTLDGYRTSANCYGEFSGGTCLWHLSECHYQGPALIELTSAITHPLHLRTAPRTDLLHDFFFQLQRLPLFKS